MREVLDQPHFVIAREIRLFFAGTNTERRLLDSTAVASEYVRARIDRWRARSIVLLVDCCYSGTMLAATRGDDGVHLTEKLAGEGRAILTASNAVEYAWEGEVQCGVGQPSLFTAAIVEGCGQAPPIGDGDGEVSVDELYDHVYERVLEAGRQAQIPLRWMHIQGRVYMAHNPPSAHRAGVDEPRRSP